MGVTIFRVADNEHVVSVAKIEESEEEEIEIESGGEIAPDEDAVVGESELDKPADPEHGVDISVTGRPEYRLRRAAETARPWPRSPSNDQGGNRSMPLPHNALVLVADGRKMLFFRNHGDENRSTFRTEAHDEREDRKDRELRTDAPGRPPRRAPETARVDLR